MVAAAQFLATKLHPPHAPANRVTRPRLLARLDENQPITLITAPAGFGKTTLLTDWMAQSQYPVAWLSLDEADNDPARFWGYVCLALRQLEPTVGEAPLALLQSPQPPATVTVLSELINQIAALPRSLALVLDDYHVIAAQPIHEMLSFLLDHLPAQMRLIITSRADPPLPLARCRSQGRLAEIRAAELRFSLDEVAAFLTQALGPKLSAGDVAALEARSEGWIAGLQLAALSLQGRHDLSGFVQAFSGSHRYIIDYLVEEVLSRQTEPIQSFLLHTAILDQLQGSLCEAVMPDNQWGATGQAMLEQVETANLFLTPLDDERDWYRYHPLFAEVLRHRLQRRQPSVVPSLHRRASAWYEQHGLAREAVQHALAAADYEQAARLMEQAGDRLVRQGEVVSLQRWVDSLPKELVRSRVELSIWQGWLLFVSGQFEAAERHLQETERAFGITRAAAEHSARLPAVSGSARPAEIFGRVAAIRASIAIRQHDLPRTIALSRQALKYLPPDNMARAYAAWYLGKAHWLSGDMEAANLALTAAARVSSEVGHLYIVCLVTHDLAQLQMAQGHLRQADQTYHQALEQAQARGGPQPAQGVAVVGRGLLEAEWNHLDQAAALFEQGRQLCGQTGNTQLILQATLGLTFVKQAQGQADEASALMQEALQMAQRQTPSQASIAQAAACQARLALRQGDAAAAVGWAQRCGLEIGQPLNHVREAEYLTLIRVRLRQGKITEARDWLTRLAQLAEAQGRAGSLIEILMLQAEAGQAAGENHQARQRLTRALSLAEPEGYRRLFVDEGAPMGRLLAQTRVPPGLMNYREQLLRSLGSGPGQGGPDSAVAAPETAQLHESLSERELTVLRLMAAGASNQEIADRLVLALSTVKWYTNIIYGKLQVESRTKAIARARELKIV